MSEARTVIAAAGVAALVAAATTLALRPRAPDEGSARPALPGSDATAEPAETGRDIAGEVPETHGASRLYRFRIPDDAVALAVTATSTELSVELRATPSRDTVPLRDEDWAWTGVSEGGTATISLSRAVDDEFGPGSVLVEVRPSFARDERAGATTASFTLRADVTLLAPPRAVKAGEDVSAQTSAATGYRCDFVVDVPSGGNVLRIDVVDTERDVDLLASSHIPPYGRDEAEWEASGPFARESLVLGPDSDPALRPGGRIWFSVVDPSLYDAPVAFRVIVTAGMDPPAAALGLPELAVPEDPRELAVASVVEVLVEDGSGSGTIVSPSGLVLTARHVIGEHTGKDGDIRIALDLDPTRMTRDLFRAEVVKIDAARDVALLRITSGLYGQPLPKGYRFPACPVDRTDALRLGEPLTTIAFPEPAGTGTRSPVLFSAGVVSGFERDRGGLRVKTDAFVASGSSGGAVLDARFRLVGVPIYTMGDSERAALIGFLEPVSQLPAEWTDLIRK